MSAHPRDLGGRRSIEDGPRRRRRAIGTMFLAIIACVAVPIPSRAAEVAYVSTSAGDWATPTIWSPNGVPGAGDTATLNHAVTITSGLSIGRSGVTNSPAITIGDGGSLVVDGATLTLLGSMDVGASPSPQARLILASSGRGAAGIEFNPPQGSRYGISLASLSVLEVRGTAAARAFVRTAAHVGDADRGAIACVGGDSGLVRASHADFVRVGSAGLSSITHRLNGPSGTVAYDHCLFDTCGRVYGEALGSESTITIDYCEWRNAQDALSGNPVRSAALFNDHAPLTIGTRRFTGNVVHGGGSIYLPNHRDWLNENNFYRGGAGYPALALPRLPEVAARSFTGNLIESTLSCAINLPGNADGNYIFANPIHGGESNWHTTISTAPPDSTQVFQNNVFEHAGRAGDGEYSSMAEPRSGAVHYVFANNLYLPNGVDHGTINGSICLSLHDAVTCEVIHNTIWTRGRQTYSGEAVLPAGRPGMVKRFQSNIIGAPGPHRSGFKYINYDGNPGSIADTIDIANLSHNSGFNVNRTGSAVDYLNQANGYAAKWSATPGQADIDVVHGVPCDLDPEFVDVGRSLPTFHRAYLDMTSVPEWVDGTVYQVGDIVSSAAPGAYRGVTINYRAIRDHQADSRNPVTDRPGTIGSSRQRIRRTGTTEGSFHMTSTLLDSRDVTAVIAMNATADELARSVQAALGAGFTVTGSGGPLAATDVEVDVRFEGSPYLLPWLSGPTDCDHWRTSWEYASSGAIAEATLADRRITDPGLGLDNATYIEALIAWVRAGFAPRNPKLKGTAHDGGDVGAIPMRPQTGEEHGLRVDSSADPAVAGQPLLERTDHRRRASRAAVIDD
jgi:hypothetical protein